MSTNRSTDIVGFIFGNNFYRYFVTQSRVNSSLGAWFWEIRNLRGCHMEFAVVWGNRALEKEYLHVGDVAVKASSNFWITITILISMPEKAIGICK